jgi:hypothetical protein
MNLSPGSAMKVGMRDRNLPSLNSSVIRTLFLLSRQNRELKIGVGEVLSGQIYISMGNTYLVLVKPRIIFYRNSENAEGFHPLIIRRINGRKSTVSVTWLPILTSDLRCRNSKKPHHFGGASAVLTRCGSDSDTGFQNVWIKKNCTNLNMF